ncbi:MAG TPA: error-prone DNA polymerase [Bdellovibrionota bacterium]
MYAELECKTNFSFLRGASHPEELIERAVELGLPAVALNDYDGVYGIPKAYWRSKRHKSLKLIVGASVSLENHPRLTLLAQNRAAYGLLCRLLTASHAGKEKGKALLSWQELATFLAEPPAQGLFLLAPLDSDCHRLQKIIPKKNLFLTLHRLLDGHDAERSEKALWLRSRFQIPLVATNDVHYHRRERQRLQDALTAIREGAPLQKLGHKLFPNGERHLKSPEQMQALFKDLPEALAASLEIAEQCRFCPSELRYRYPSEWIPESHNAQSYLEKLTWEGAIRRYPHGVPEKVQEQIHGEFALIAKLQYADYFLTIHDVVDFARQKNILCQGRGAAANSTVCYCLGITAVDPAKFDLLFERFLSEERREPPDIDVDFEHERREEVLQYIYEKYGRHRAAMVSAVITYRSRSALREIAKALGLEVGTLSAKKLKKVFSEKAAASESKNAFQLTEELSEEMSGFPRHLSIHSGGFTLSADPITEIVPVETARMEGRTIIQWDKYDLDYLGLLKVDLLALGMLTALHRTLKLVGKELHSLNPEMNDAPTYAMIQQADTVGTFQIESRAQMSMLGRLLPANFYDLVIEVAIVRPGPIVGGMVHPYLKRRRGLEKADSPHPKLEAILRRTLGVPLFQEQVMKIAIDLGGFSPGESDQLRRAIGAWRSSGEIKPMAERLKKGLIQSGLTEDYADRILGQIAGFAEYGFPESHAASFAMLAYASCYLKRHHHAEFTCGLLNSLPMGFYQAHTLVDDAKLHGISVLPVDPNISEWECVMEKGAVRLGWKLVNGLHRKEADALLAARPFSSFADFLRRTSLRRDLLLRLAGGGTFSCFGLEPRTALWHALESQRRQQPHQGDLFLDGRYEFPPSSASSFSPLSEFSRIQEQYGAFSLSTHGHPMMALRKMLRLPKLHTQSAKQLKNGSHLSVSGLILVRQKPPTAKKMTFSTLEDEFGFLDLAISPQVYERVKDTFLENCFLEVRGKLQKETNSFSVWVSDLRPLWTPQNAPELFIEPTQYFH